MRTPQSECFGTRRDLLFNPDSFPNVATVQLKWAEVENEQTEFVNGLTDELLERTLSFRATQVGLMHLVHIWRTTPLTTEAKSL